MVLLIGITDPSCQSACPVISFRRRTRNHSHSDSRIDRSTKLPTWLPKRIKPSQSPRESPSTRQAFCPPRSVSLQLIESSRADVRHEKCESPQHPNAPFAFGPSAARSYSYIPGWYQKKGGAAQKQIKQIAQASAAAKTPEQKRKDAEKEQREKEKAAAEQAKRETAELFKPVQVQKVPFGVDPKTVLCQFFKQGFCDKGNVYPFPGSVGGNKATE